MVEELKVVNVTVKLAVPKDVHVDDLIDNLNYQFSYVDENDDELIVDTEITNVVEW